MSASTPTRSLGAGALVCLVALVGAPTAVHAQSPENGASTPKVLDVTTDESAVPVPFGPGERLEYRVKLNVMNVGQGHMEVEGIEEVRGHPTYHVSMGVDASMGFGLAKVNDRWDSWLDTRLLVSRRFVRDINELNYHSNRVFDIYPEERRWERADEPETFGRTPSMLALDEIAFLYFIRTLPLEVGAEYEFNRYFKEDGNPVRVKVLRKQTVEVPAGTFETIVVQPIIETSGLFSEGGEAEVYLTDDEDRRMVFLSSKIPIVGALTLALTSARAGTPLNPDAR